MKILILGGFLGSGKTTLLLQLAHYVTDTSTKDSGYKVMILENEVGQEGIDDKILRGSGFGVTNLFSGCACCTLAGELVSAAKQIQNEYQPDWLIIETTGLAYPGLIRDNLVENLHLETRICVVADVSRWDRLRIPLQNLIVGQIECADVVLLNKCDQATEQELLEIEKDVCTINQNAELIRTSALDKVDTAVWRTVLGGVQNA